MMIRLLLTVVLFVGCVKKIDGPKEWVEWVNSNRASFKKEFAVPTVTQHIYLKPGERAFVTKEERGVRLVAKTCKENCLYTLSFQKGRVLLEDINNKKPEQILKEKEKVEITKPHYVSYIFYKEENKVRLFLYNTAQKNIVKKSKRYFFNYDETYKVQGTFRWLQQPKSVVFGRSDGSKKTYQVLAKIKYNLKGTESELSIYNTNTSKRFDKKSQQSMLMYRDSSNNKKTYGAGRFLNVNFDKPIGEFKDGDVLTVDFNYSYNPPCATSTGFHCPLPQDMVAREVMAGESYYKFQ